MLARMRRLLLPLIFVLGCYQTQEAPKPAGLKLPKQGFSAEDLDQALRLVVGPKGEIQRGQLDAAKPHLARFVGLLALRSPSQDPEHFRSKNSAIAYWLNAYIGLSLYGLATHPELQSMEKAKRDFFFFTRYSLRQGPMSIYDVELEIKRLYPKDARLRAMLSCLSADCPPPPARALTAENLNASLKSANQALCARLEIQAPKTLPAAKGSSQPPKPPPTEVVGSQFFDWYQKDWESAGGLIPFCRKHGRTDIPGDAQLVTRLFDWRLPTP